MHGPEILVRTLSEYTRPDKHGNPWQYHSRSDHHSKVACWGVLFDLMLVTPLLRKHADEGRIVFGINHEMRDFARDRKKDLDLVLCTPNGANGAETFASLAGRYAIRLTDEEKLLLAGLPPLHRAPVGSVVMALEAKAAMTAHQRALPRFYDELNSSHQTVHGSSEQALAVAFAMINIAIDYLSPDLNKKNRATAPEWSRHSQPRDASLAIEKVKQLPRRANTGEAGFDAIAIVVIDMANDGTLAKLTSDAPAPVTGDNYHYDSMINRLSGLYATRFQHL